MHWRCFHLPGLQAESGVRFCHHIFPLLCFRPYLRCKRSVLPEGLIVYTEDKDGNREEEKCDGKNELRIPLAVLVNESSASASEIFAGAVQDYGIGTIVGTTTYGKGVVQSIRQLSDGSAIKLTVANYYTPKGNNINKTGIKPDIEVSLDTSLLNKNKDEITHDEDNQLQEAIKAVEKEK